MGKNGCSFSIIWVYMYLQENLLKYFLGNQVEGHEEIAWNLQHACFHCLWNVLQSEKKGNTISKVQTITIIYLLIITLQHSYCKQWPSYNLWSEASFFFLGKKEEEEKRMPHTTALLLICHLSIAYLSTEVLSYIMLKTWAMQILPEIHVASWKQEGKKV